VRRADRRDLDGPAVDLLRRDPMAEMEGRARRGRRTLPAGKPIALKPERGDMVWEIDHHKVIWQSVAKKKIYTCECITWEWECEEVAPNIIHCKWVCKTYRCTPLPEPKPPQLL
jgi:hypothetical protein